MIRISPSCFYRKKSQEIIMLLGRESQEIIMFFVGNLGISPKQILVKEIRFLDQKKWTKTHLF